MNKVTVFMPVYNAGSFLEEAVVGILNHIYKEFGLYGFHFSSEEEKVLIKMFQGR